jgi:hypothetical protein
MGISSNEGTNGSKKHISISDHPVITANMVTLHKKYKTSQLNEKKPHDIIVCNRHEAEGYGATEDYF